DSANAKVNQRYSEWQDAYAHLNSFNGPTEATAETQPQPESESESVIRSKPTPEAAPAPEVTPLPAPEIAPAPQVTPAPEVTPSPSIPEATKEAPKELPKTASSLDLLGFIGVLSTSGSHLIKLLRRQS